MDNKTQTILKEHLELNLARIKAMSSMILAMISARSVQLSVLARYFAAPIKEESAFKRMQRFLREVTLPDSCIALLVLSILGLKKGDKLVFILDRSNWQFGRAHVNILFLSVVLDGVSVPIFFKLLANKKDGSSSYLDRIELVEKAIGLLGRSSIRCILGDREFVGKQWILWLRRKRLSFVMRLNHKRTKIASVNEEFINGERLFATLKKGRKRFLGFCYVGETDSYKCCVSSMRTYKGDLVVLVHSEDISSPQEMYRQRWKIESMFRALKTGGFDLENSHLTATARISTLLSLVIIAFCFALKAGKLSSHSDEIPVKKMVTNL